MEFLAVMTQPYISHEAQKQEKWSTIIGAMHEMHVHPNP